MTLTRACTCLGRALGGVFYLVGRARLGHIKALHPRGEVWPGVLTRRHPTKRTGVAWLDEPGRDEVVVRRSRSAGLPAPLPDVLGLAVRVPLGSGGHGDLLLASTWPGRWGRYVARPAWRYDAVPYCSLFPYRTALGPLVLGAVPVPERRDHYELVWARPTGPWQPFGTLVTASAQGEPADTEVTFDPVLHVLPGLEAYGCAAELRRYAYAASRQARRLA